VRRSFIDFGLFHVEQKFYGVWKQFHYVLKQRNACLKQKLGKNEVAIWSKEFCELANTLDKYRKEYLDKFRVKYLELLTRILPNYDDIHLRYHSGWNSEYDLQDLLEQNYFSDNRIGFTQLGPHRADLQLYYSENIPAQDAFSQGQQKLASYALYLTQGALLQELQNISPIYLIDDLPSELDMDKNRQLVSILKEMQAQIFVTGVQKQDLEYWSSTDEVQMFHVKQGEIEKQTTLS
jgi:DNA replication and repair protein RecF